MEYDINKVSPRPWFYRNVLDTSHGFENPMGIIEDGTEAPERAGTGRTGNLLAKCWGGRDTPAEGNTAHIVHCVNVHDDLVAALEWLTNVAYGCSKRDGEMPNEQEWKDAMESAKAALARARGEK